MKTLALILGLFIPVIALGQTVTGVSGTVADGQQVTITGSGFGANGPDIVVFDDFKNGSHGDIIPLDGAAVGEWGEYGSADGFTEGPRYYDDGTGNICFWAFQPTTYQLRAEFAQSSDAFVSYRYMIPDGYNFPGCETPGEFDFYANNSTWKLAWLLECSGCYSHLYGSDAIFPTQSMGTKLFVGGNSGPLRNDPETGEPGFAPEVGHLDRPGPPDGNRTWSWGNWNRFTGTMIAPPSGTGPDGYLWTQTMSEEYGQYLYENNHIIIHRESENINPWFTRFNIPGWGYSNCTDDPDNVDCEVRILHDDIYLAIGEHCRARVEIGNNSAYENCTNMAISTVDSWSDTSIAATVRGGQMPTSGTAYLFVVHSDGSISDGYEVTMGGTGGGSAIGTPSLTRTGADLDLTWTAPSTTPDHYAVYVREGGASVARRIGVTESVNMDNITVAGTGQVDVYVVAYAADGSIISTSNVVTDTP